MLDASIWRIILTTVCSSLVFLPLTWFMILNEDERSFMRTRIMSKFGIK
jgi:hypothetical protein